MQIQRSSRFVDAKMGPLESYFVNRRRFSSHPCNPIVEGSERLSVGDSRRLTRADTCKMMNRFVRAEASCDDDFYGVMTKRKGGHREKIYNEASTGSSHVWGTLLASTISCAKISLMIQNIGRNEKDAKP